MSRRERSTLSKGYITDSHITQDKLGRPLIELRVTLTWTDDILTLLQQATQAADIQIITDTKAQLLPMFPLNPPAGEPA